MIIRVNNWAGSYELTLSDKNKKVYVTVYLKKDEAETLERRLGRALRPKENKSPFSGG